MLSWLWIADERFWCCIYGLMALKKKRIQEPPCMRLVSPMMVSLRIVAEMRPLQQPKGG